QPISNTSPPIAIVSKDGIIQSKIFEASYAESQHSKVGQEGSFIFVCVSE
ncbi:hypothetical protein BaRGS_00032446, partial [Batillaria attramentaria]